MKKRMFEIHSVYLIFPLEWTNKLFIAKWFQQFLFKQLASRIFYLYEKFSGIIWRRIIY